MTNQIHAEMQRFFYSDKKDKYWIKKFLLKLQIWKFIWSEIDFIFIEMQNLKRRNFSLTHLRSDHWQGRSQSVEKCRNKYASPRHIM